MLVFWAGCATHTPTAADQLLQIPTDVTARSYLGLAAKSGTFQLEDIQCDILVIDCFDIYCHNCWAGAPQVNKLYQLVQTNSLGNRIKFIGLGVGDTPLEAVAYKQELHVPFPVFSDRHTAITQRFGPVQLPNLLVLRKLNGHLILIQSVSGALLDPAGLLAHLRAKLSTAKLHSWSSIAQLAQPTCSVNSCSCPFPQGVKIVSSLQELKKLDD